MGGSADRQRVVIMGAAGRDFHNFNVVYRDDPACEVVAFTAAQIPGIAERSYPPVLAGDLYPEGIPILPEDDLEAICRQNEADVVVFAYSDIEHAFVMHQASKALSAGAEFRLLGPGQTMLKAEVPVIAVCAVRTGVGKSQTTRYLSRRLGKRGVRTAVIRHPMPYGNLADQAVQRFSSLKDLDAADCTVEEREEYEPHIAIGNTVFAGVDYGLIRDRAQEEADVILWDGGNNDFSFLRPDLQIVLIDPLRPGHATTHHPGEAVLRMADIVVVAKTNVAAEADIHQVIENARLLAPDATIVRGASTVTLDQPDQVRGRRVLVVEDGPTITHGGMAYGAGYVASIEAGASEIVDPRIAATGDLSDAYVEYPHIGNVLPAMGYSEQELSDLEATINGSSADVVVTGTPSDLSRLLNLDKPVVRARYEFDEVSEPGLGDLVDQFIDEREAKKGRP